MRTHKLGAVLSLIVLLLTAAPAGAARGSGYQTDFTRWRAATGGFATWQRSGVDLAVDGGLTLNLAAATVEDDPYQAGSYNGGNFYNGGSYRVGSATSPVLSANFAFSEAIASWNAVAPPQTWMETLIRARVGGGWTKWYNLGVWSADSTTVQRHSVSGQGDASGFVAVDTLVLSDRKLQADGFQLRVRLFSAGTATPTLRSMSVAYSTAPSKSPALSAGSPAHWGQTLDVPACSQMVYPDGGEVWCSPTSTSMVLAYWGDLPGACEPRVRAAVTGTYDWIYDGHGNWPFNTAYAATRGYEAYVARFSSLAQAEPWISAGVPVIVSFAWSKGDLDGAAIANSAGHLAVLVGFDSAGNPVINDPAAASDGSVRRTYDRAQFEKLWLYHSGGTVYLIYPTGTATPSL